MDMLNLATQHNKIDLKALLKQANDAGLLGQTETVDTGSGTVKIQTDVFGNQKVTGQDGPLNISQPQPFNFGGDFSPDSLFGSLPTMGGGSVSTRNSGIIGFLLL